jgi:DNA-binding NtrC family response regulator
MRENFMAEDGIATVLIVDDEEMVVRSLESFLTLETSHRVLTFCSPVQALEALEREDRIHVVVADFMMPEMDGITFLHEVRVRSPETSRILLTGYADKENAIRAINDVGLYSYVEKPWDNEHMKLLVRNGTERSALFHELTSRKDALVASHAELEEFHRKLARAFL